MADPIETLRKESEQKIYRDWLRAIELGGDPETAIDDLVILIALASWNIVTEEIENITGSPFLFTFEMSGITAQSIYPRTGLLGETGLTGGQIAEIERYSQVLQAENATLAGDGAASSDLLSQTEIDRMVAARTQKAQETSAALAAILATTAAIETSKKTAWDVSGLSYENTWVSRGDSLVRHSHARLNGTTLPAGEAFVGDYGLVRFPGDPNAPLQETANCRCRLKFKVKR